MTKSTPNADRDGSARLLDHWATWLAVDPASLKAALEPVALPNLASACQLSTIASSEQTLRRLAMAMLRRLGPRGRWAMTTGLKRARRIAGYRAGRSAAGSCAALFHRLKITLNAQGFRWGAKRAAVCLTHDIDARRDWEALPDVLDLEQAAGVRSTVNLLSQGGYDLDASRISGWAQAGVEFGLHGDDHDIAFGFRPAQEIRRRLERARHAMPVPIHGFRAPALSGSERLVAALDDLGFGYDSSWLAGDASGGRIGACFPFRHEGRALWEIPLALQDSMLFRDERLSDAAALEVTRAALINVTELNGVLVLNTHPGILAQAPAYYRGVLELLRRHEPDVAILTMGGALALVQRAQRTTPVAVGS